MPPPIPSMPYAPKSLYTPRYADNIAQLLTRQGDIQAAGAARSGEIWGNFARDIGQIGGQAVTAYGEHKAQQKEEERQKQSQVMFETAVNSFDPTKPMDTYRKLAVAVGPEHALEFTKGIVALQKLQTPEAGAEDFKQSVDALWRTKQIFGPDYLAQKWPELSGALQKGADKFLPGADLSQLTPEILKGIDTLHQEFSGKASGDSFTLGAGQVRYDASGKQIAAGPEKPETPGNPEPVTINGKATMATPAEIAQAKAQGATVVPYVAPKSEGAGSSFQAKEVLNDDGKTVMANYNSQTGQYTESGTGKVIANPRPIPSGQEKKATGAERLTLGFYRRMKEATADLEPIEDVVAKYGPIDQQRLAYEGVGSNLTQTSEMQRYRQAQRAFTEARLRKESGAAIPPHEYTNDAKTYFAQPGDSEKTKEQKRRGRAVIEDSLRFAAGNAYEEFYGEPAPKPANSPGGGGKIDPEVQKRLDRLRGL